MTASALFQIDPATGTYGTSGAAADVVDAAVSQTVNCRITSIVGVDSIAWRIFGTHGIAAPTITLSGSPNGQIASFAVTGNNPQAYGIECKINGGMGVADNGDTKLSALYVIGADGERPFFLGETFESDATYGVVPRFNVPRSLPKIRTVGTANHSLSAFVGVTGGSSTNTDGVLAVRGDIVLLTAQTSATQNGPWLVGLVTAGTAPLTRPTWFAAASKQPTGLTLQVGGEGTVFKNTVWKAFVAATSFLVDTTDGKFYPLSVSGQTALAAGTFTISTVPIFSTKTNVVPIRSTANTCTATTGGYVMNGNPTAGVIGVGSIAVMASVAAGTINNADISTINWTVINQA